jgi:hypothetical protein
MNEPFPLLRLPPRLVYEFLGPFARCEYALKGAGFAKGNATSVEADWNKFAKSIDWHLRRAKEPEFQQAVEFLLAEPPRKQVLQNGYVRWKDSPPDSNLPKAERVLLLVRRVRNNLFHGAKVWSPEYGNGARDRNLIIAALVVLKGCIRFSELVHRAYGEGMF